MVVHKAGYLIKHMREQKGWSQGDLAKEARLSQSMVSEIERNTKNPGADVLKNLADVLGFNMNEFFEGRKF